MKTYIGVKIVQAEPCTLGMYNTRRGWQIPADENPNRPGYYLRYPDGYQSWSPAEIFAAAYRLVTPEERALVDKAVKPLTFYDRLLIESKELEERVEKLGDFMSSEAYRALDEGQRKLLADQWEAMSTYSAILGKRISSIEPPKPADEFAVVGEIKTTGGDHAETPVPFKGDE